MNRLLPLMVLVVLSLAPRIVRASDGHPKRASVHLTTHGLRIALATGRRSYPRNAIISVHLKVRNITHHGIVLLGGLAAPEVVVVPDDSQEGYDPEAPLGRLTLLTIN